MSNDTNKTDLELNKNSKTSNEEAVFSKKPLADRTTNKTLRKLCLQWQDHVMVLPGIIFLIIFSYVPIYGIVTAFKDFEVHLGFFNSPWAVNAAGELDLFKYFKMFAGDAIFWKSIKNTLIINLLGLIISFPAPIIFSLFLVEIPSKVFRKSVQMVSYMPYFISWIVFGGLVIKILDPYTGALGQILVKLNVIGEGYYLLSHPEYVYSITIISALIKDLGWGSIIYLAALTSVSSELIEAADIEGATRLQKMRYISLPTIMGTVSIYLIFRISGMLGSNFDQMYILKNNTNKSTAEVIDTYVYYMGIEVMDLPYSTAVGLARSLVSFLLLLVANFASKKISGKGLY